MGIIRENAFFEICIPVISYVSRILIEIDLNAIAIGYRLECETCGVDCL